MTATDGPRPDTDPVVAGLSWLVGAQAASGELPSHAGPFDRPIGSWDPDPLNFITALGAVALARVDHPDAQRVVDRAVHFLQEEREGPGLWRYWSRSNPQVDFTPPDADDTACCSMAVALRGHSTAGNVAVLEATAAPDGRFRTWLIPHRASPTLGAWWALRDERRAATRQLRRQLWETTEAEPDDIDAVVNANVCRYLGPERAPAASVAWVAEVVEADIGTGDKWHRRSPVLWSAVADGARRGIERFRALRPTVLDRIVAATADEARPSFERAHLLLSLQAFDGPVSTRRVLADGLRSAQASDGSWPRDVCYYGGPREVFGWASDGLTTALAVAALSGERTSS